MYSTETRTARRGMHHKGVPGKTLYFATKAVLRRVEPLAENIYAIDFRVTGERLEDDKGFHLKRGIR